METVDSLRSSKALAAGVVAVAGFLLLSMGGAIVAAPATIPLLILVARHHRASVLHASAIVVATGTMAEVAWAITYLVAGEARPWIWLLPLGAALVTAITARSISRPHRNRAQTRTA